MSIEINLAQKVVLITGASQGIGAQMAQLFHRAGATVALNHPDIGTSRQDAETLVNQLNALRPQSACAVAADVADAAAVQAMMQELKRSFGGIDFLINNAAILRDRSLAKMSLDEWNAVIGVNLSGVFHCCKFGLEIMRDGGSVVSLGSIAALQGFFGQANYAAAKAGLHGLTMTLARELSGRAITANAVAPGFITTDMTGDLSEEVKQKILSVIPLGRFGSVNDIAAMVDYLASEEGGYITGQVFSVDGGMAI